MILKTLLLMNLLNCLVERFVCEMKYELYWSRDDGLPSLRLSLLEFFFKKLLKINWHCLDFLKQRTSLNGLILFENPFQIYSTKVIQNFLFPKRKSTIKFFSFKLPPSSWQIDRKFIMIFPFQSFPLSSRA